MTAQAEAITVRPHDPTTREVRVLLARHDMHDQELAPVLGISRQAVGSRMRGATPWTLADLDALAFYFRVDANTLLPRLGKEGVRRCLNERARQDSNLQPSDP